ncbi:tripartite tricarboxylate transporter substrate binding protein [Pigmentiphaga sp. H8]|uniref:Bug family tripartite tricarboxylate transporter substrate binding protein n=1 Tax=unclassified Pigmentiphaga TaxID=2626614 RepID=UPI000F59B8D6|nr:tripartite tricarboxylate transporter substrate binding protein [Pigmentiphaga sp. H8]AZG06620.1 tripartite tricarboxylate transporter substrate binding protein [Pigmentiphaga sp. H8]
MPLVSRLIASALCASLVLPVAAHAQSYPSRPIKLVVPFPPGGATDMLGRIMADKLAERLGQPVIVENKPGAGGTIGSLQVARAQADGHTLVLGVTGTHAISHSLYSKPAYDPVRDFAAISRLVTGSQVLVVNPAVPATSLATFIGHLRAHPGKLTYGSSGNGTALHLTGELFAMHTGTDMLHVAYKGTAELVTALLSGQIDAVFASPSNVVSYLDTGRLRFLATTGSGRDPKLASVPTMREAGLPDFEVLSWQGLFAPAGTPPAIVDRLHAATVAILSLPDVRDALTAHGFVASPMTPQAFQAFVSSEKDRWRAVVQRAGVRVD